VERRALTGLLVLEERGRTAWGNPTTELYLLIELGPGSAAKPGDRRLPRGE
jgi:hypothetical protein